MITFDEFKAIDIEVSSAIDEVLDFIKLKSKDYILLLAHAEHHKLSLGNTSDAYYIDDATDKWRDLDRRDFFSAYMDNNYDFPQKTSVVFNKMSIQLELMLYTHIWESKPFLRKLFRIATLADNKLYPWKVEVPSYKKEDYIRKVIRKVFEDKGLSIAKVIKEGFHTSLRNAFAHSDYSISYYNKRIDLLNFKGGAWELKDITFAEWARRFAYSALLSHNLYSKLYERTVSLPTTYGTNEFVIMLPKSPNISMATKIYYHPESGYFNFHS